MLITVYVNNSKFKFVNLRNIKILLKGLKGTITVSAVADIKLQKLWWHRTTYATEKGK